MTEQRILVAMDLAFLLASAAMVWWIYWGREWWETRRDRIPERPDEPTARQVDAAIAEAIAITREAAG